MPHQCLTCGESFADGSTDLLKGCPQCEGTRFFYTDEPLDDSERAELKDQTDKNVHQMLEEILESGEKRNLGEDIWSKDAWERWIRVERDQDGEAKPVSAYLDEQDADPVEAAAGEEPGAEFEQVKKPALQVKLDDVEEIAPPEEVPAPEEPEVPPEAVRPSTLNIVEPGNYEIDVERLMEDSPVIVERDGSYVIHLPSVFDKGKRR